MILETERLYLREMNQTDFGSLCKILQDEDTMYAYEGAFDDDEVQQWLDRQCFRYQQWGFGLWAAILRETNEMTGQCGLTMQTWKEKELGKALSGDRYAALSLFDTALTVSGMPGRLPAQMQTAEGLGKNRICLVWREDGKNI